MKYHLIHHGSHHSFDEIEPHEKNSEWIYYVADGCRHGAPRSLLSETFEGACIKYAEHCVERIQSNCDGVKTYLRQAQEQADNILSWQHELIRFQQTLLSK